jgi:hypothetical protein
MLLFKYVLSNTNLDDKTEQIQVTRDKKNTRMPNMMTTLLNI